MILTFKSKAYLQQLSIFAWIFLFNIPLINNLAPQGEQWITLCTQQGLRLINVNNTEQSQTKKEDYDLYNVDNVSKEDVFDMSINDTDVYGDYY